MSNSFGKMFRITTWGESHGQAVGVTVDGCPPQFALEEADIQKRTGQAASGAERYLDAEARRATRRRFCPACSRV